MLLIGQLFAENHPDKVTDLRESLVTIPLDVNFAN